MYFKEQNFKEALASVIYLKNYLNGLCQFLNKKLCLFLNLWADAIDGKNVKESAKRRFEESLDELRDKAGVMRGNGFRKPINNKRKKENNIRKKKNKNKNKRDFDIFDKK
jgi:hypothetical protein